MLVKRVEGRESMRLRVDTENDALYLRLNETVIVESEEVEPGIILDFDESGRVVGIEILGVNTKTFHYYPETDSLYIELSSLDGANSREVAPGIVLDFDAEGHLVGIDIDQASRQVDLTQLEAVALPLQTLAVAR
jgi:uncharacterized protein YuzE